jgi:type IV secretory pathway VirJ component
MNVYQGFDKLSRTWNENIGKSATRAIFAEICGLDPSTVVKALPALMPEYIKHIDKGDAGLLRYELVKPVTLDILMKAYKKYTPKRRARVIAAAEEKAREAAEAEEKAREKAAAEEKAKIENDMPNTCAKLGILQEINNKLGILVELYRTTPGVSP